MEGLKKAYDDAREEYKTLVEMAAINYRACGKTHCDFTWVDTNLKNCANAYNLAAKAYNDRSSTTLEFVSDYPPTLYEVGFVEEEYA